MFAQKGNIVGKVVFAKVEAKETKGGKKYEEYTAMVRTIEGVTFVLQTRFWESRKAKWNDDRKAKIKAMQDNFYTNILDVYKTDDVYAGIFFQPAIMKDGKTVQFNTLKSRKKDDGSLTFTMELFETLPTVIETFEEEGELKVKTKNGKIMPMSAYGKTNIEVTMAVKMVDGNSVDLIDAEGEYPNELTVEFDKGADKLEIGQGYVFKLVPKKGGKITEESADEFSFDEEVKVAYAPDCLTVIGGGKKKGYTLNMSFDEDLEDDFF